MAVFVIVWAVLTIVGVSLVTFWAIQGRSAMPRSSIAAGPVWVASGVVIVAVIALLVASVVSNLAGGRKVNVAGDSVAGVLAVACAVAFLVGLRRHRGPTQP